MQDYVEKGFEIITGLAFYTRETESQRGWKTIAERMGYDDIVMPPLLFSTPTTWGGMLLRRR